MKQHLESIIDISKSVLDRAMSTDLEENCGKSYDNRHLLKHVAALSKPTIAIETAIAGIINSGANPQDLTKLIIGTLSEIVVVSKNLYEAHTALSNADHTPLIANNIIDWLEIAIGNKLKDRRQTPFIGLKGDQLNADLCSQQILEEVFNDDDGSDSNSEDPDAAEPQKDFLAIRYGNGKKQKILSDPHVNSYAELLASTKSKLARSGEQGYITPDGTFYINAITKSV